MVPEWRRSKKTSRRESLCIRDISAYGFHLAPVRERCHDCANFLLPDMRPPMTTQPLSRQRRRAQMRGLPHLATLTPLFTMR
ncbi:hypothetical protein CQA86_01730 [Klebsiella pneumoniae]|nr:hypothetical protein CQA86_01730 [Klebsiella pneumoniae]